MSKDIKILRIRFVIIVILIVTVVLSCIFGSFVRLTNRFLERNETQFANEIANDPTRYLTSRQASDSDLPYLVVEVIESSSGVVPIGYFGINDVLMEDGTPDNRAAIGEIIQIVYESEEDNGLISQYNLRYCKKETVAGTYNYAMVNISRDIMTMNAIRLRMTTLSVLGIAIFALIAAILSKWAIKPIENAWTQQKQFVSDASHELKTPLTVITTNAELLQTEGISEEEIHKYTNNIVTVSHQMKGLVEDLLNLARLENSDKSDFERVDLSEVCQNVIMQFEPLFFELGHTLHEETEPGIFVNGNSQRLNQLVTILLDNAGKYSEPGDIGITLKKYGRSAVLCVNNPSEPLSEQQLNDIFKRFYRADESRNEKNSYGLGLSIAKSICEAHGGRIAAEYNDGTISFKATLPAL